jgi:hypothetical protein
MFERFADLLTYQPSKGLSDRAIIALFTLLFVTQIVILFKEFIGFASLGGLASDSKCDS